MSQIVDVAVDLITIIVRRVSVEVWAKTGASRIFGAKPPLPPPGRF